MELKQTVRKIVEFEKSKFVKSELSCKGLLRQIKKTWKTSLENGRIWKFGCLKNYGTTVIKKFP